jgi:hypothetical protein
MEYNLFFEARRHVRNIFPDKDVIGLKYSCKFFIILYTHNQVWEVHNPLSVVHNQTLIESNEVLVVSNQTPVESNQTLVVSNQAPVESNQTLVGTGKIRNRKIEKQVEKKRILYANN